MLRKRFLLTMAMAAGIGFGAAAQTVDEVVNNYMNALGGKDKLASIKSLYMEGVSVMQNGTEIESKVWKVQDKLYRREISFGMGNIVVLATDKQGWSASPQSNGEFKALQPDALKDLQEEMDCAGPLTDYAAKGHKAELAGREDLNGVSCYKIKLTLKDGKDISYYIDPNTWYIVREVRKTAAAPGGRGGNGGGDGTLTIDYSGYKKTEDGYVFRMTVAIVGRGASLNYEKVDVNKAVDAALYQPK